MLTVSRIPPGVAEKMVVEHHYLHRRAPISFAYGLYSDDLLVGVVTIGCPASHQLRMGACPECPQAVMELNRLWVSDEMPRNTESWFLARALSVLPPMIIVSYADTKQKHMGTVYRASNFFYAGWTDMDRATARLDYLTPGKHTRDAFRSGSGASSETVRRKPKVKYWTVTGNRRDRKRLKMMCAWPILSWNDLPPPTEHQQAKYRSRR